MLGEALAGWRYWSGAAGHRHLFLGRSGWRYWFIPSTASSARNPAGPNPAGFFFIWIPDG